MTVQLLLLFPSLVDSIVTTCQLPCHFVREVYQEDGKIKKKIAFLQMFMSFADLVKISCFSLRLYFSELNFKNHQYF